MKKVLLAIFVVGLGLTGFGLYLRHEWQVVTVPTSTEIIDIPHGLSATEVVELLYVKNVISNRYAAMAYIFISGSRNKLKAGEYLFDRPMNIPQALQKLSTGAVYLHRFTVPEGMTTAGIARKWEEQGFGTAEDFLKAAVTSVGLVRSFDVAAESVEGYLFPETYSFPRGASPQQAIRSMVRSFQQTFEKLQDVLPAEKWPLNLHDTVILASLVESETAQPAERPLVASVYLNRLNRHIPLQCDPTVIYALLEADLYRGKLSTADLQFKSRYNTYLNQGLPPGAISNPGFPSLLAAIQPATTNYLYFVRSGEPKHTFSETLAAHNRAVAAYRRARKP